MKFSRLAAARLNYLCGVGLWRCNLSGSSDSIHCTFEAGSIIHRWKKFIRGWSGQRGGGTIKCIGGELFPIVLNAAVGCNHLNMNETVTVLRPKFVRRLAEATVVTVEQLFEEKLQQNHPLADMSLCGERPPVCTCMFKRISSGQGIFLHQPLSATWFLGLTQNGK